MAITRRFSSIGGNDDGERPAGDQRSSKRQRIPPVDEDEERTRMATVGNDSQDDVITDGQSAGSSSKSPQSLKLQSSDLLDCPTCCNPLKRPIYQCNNGHIACSSCCTKLKKKCSFCKSSIGDIRCRAMENIIEATIVSCPNAIYGCKETTTYGNQSNHEKNHCVFTRCSCPVLYCNYVGSYKDLKSHSRAHTDHEEEYDNRIIRFRLNRTFDFAMSFLNSDLVVLQEEEEGDLFVVQAFRGSSSSLSSSSLRGEQGQCVYVTVRCIAPPGVSNFSCSLAKRNKFSTLRLGMMVKKVQKVVLGEEFEQPEDDDDGGFMFIPSYMLSNSNEQWNMEICIGRGSDYIKI